MLFSILGCEKSIPNDETQMVQACLDKLHQNKDWDYLAQSNLVLVKNNYSSGLGNLHFIKKHIVLIAAQPSDIKVYTSEKDVIDNKRYLIIKSISINDKKAKIVIGLPNVNQQLDFNLIKDGIVWRVDTVKYWVF